MEEIDLEMGPGYDDGTHFDSGAAQNLAIIGVNDHGLKPAPRKKKKVVKRWRDEWAETYKWAYVAVHEGSHRIFCSVCKEYGRKHRRNPYGNEGSRNMQMSALEEHNNSLLHKEALRLQMASRDRGMGIVERPLYVKDVSRQCTNEGYFQHTVSSSILRRDPHEVEFIQSIQEVVHSLEPVLAKVPQYVHVFERLVEPERVTIFKVPWVDDKGEAHVNRGFRVQFNQALGPYKGGLRFHPTVNLSVVKFLAFEQTLRNSLSSLSLGGGQGGSDFNPKGKSENEIMRFCYSFMEELYRHIGPNQVPIFDTPSGDIGVGQREIGYLFGQYRRLTSQYEGILGPKGIQWGASNLHSEATGYGVVYYAKEVLASLEKDLKGLRCVVSGAGKVALYAVEKLIAFGAIPVTVSDTSGYILDEGGFDRVKLGFIREIKAHNKCLRDYTKNYSSAKYFEDMKPWTVKCDVAFPCATQNELNHVDALSLINVGCQVIIEGANMPCTAEAIDVFRKSKVWFGPGKAANAGGVTIQGLEMSQNNSCAQWTAEEVDTRLEEVMKDIYQKSVKAAQDYGIGNPEALLDGANIASFLRVAQAMLEQGCV
ncbi:uncharacterized protein [Physcomitrium patens]|uniref:glutamate dehydrogenase (NADP(+)) n=1 Tax=Physcomitrium patens TaxID=3218 RepID=A0A7I4D4Y6_PHYPA|nr:NADP-specific glutamate dehydrogenase-like isoform X2 [Physcomitrium patens]|eukprot:XP_024369120.1 NADP-specific glutamate dehydrogenase-like isoform X2 [Physcomitrella patens]